MLTICRWKIDYRFIKEAVIKILSFTLKAFIEYKIRKLNEKNICHWKAFEKKTLFFVEENILQRQRLPWHRGYAAV